MAKSVIITGIGGSLAIDIARCLREDTELRLIGCDSNPWALRQTSQLVDASVSVPRADQDPEAFFATLEQLASEESAAYVFVNAEPEIAAYAATQPTLPCASSLPSASLCRVIRDKAATAQTVDDRRLLPGTIAIMKGSDIDQAFALLPSSPGAPLWLRARVGAGGLASLEVRDAAEARAWMAYWERRDKGYSWVLHEMLPGRNINWTGLYREGELVAGASMERLRYYLGGSTASGVSGQTAQGVTVDPAPYTPVCDQVVRAVDAEPNGLWSIDLRHDVADQPRVTEINPRLAGRPYLYACAGVNLPRAAVRSAARETLGEAIDASGLRLGLEIYRQLDIEPVISTKSEL